VNKVKTLLMGSVVTLILSSQAMAAFSLNGTRFIYHEGSKNLSFEVTNTASDTYGGQVWLDNVTHGKEDVHIIPSPPFFKVGDKQKQIVRLLKVGDGMPGDRESLFWLNVQEVPPKPKDAEGSYLAIAMNTQVKLIYRPKILAAGRQGAEKKVTRVNRDGVTYLKNPTPYYFAVSDVKQDGQSVPLSSALAEGIAVLAPHSEASLGKAVLGKKVTIDTVNDWGGVDTHSID